MFTKALKTLSAILLIPIAIGTAKAFYSQITGIGVHSGALHMLERGALVYFLLHILIKSPDYLYVLGHEAVHVIATWLCLGKVLSFKVSSSGGHVETSKTNFFIDLSPYFVPIYTVLLAPVFMLLKTTGKGNIFTPPAFIFLVGLTLAFHLAMTSEALRIKQPDIMKSGPVFSFILIFVGNLAITMAVFCPIFKNLSFLNFLHASATHSNEIFRAITANALEFVNAAGIW